jgi:hypothetical protein
MGDAKSGNQQTMQTSNTTSASSPNPYIQPALQGLLGQMDTFRNANPNAPGYYPGGTVAGRTPGDRSASTANWQWGTQSLNGLDTAFHPAINYLSNTANGQGLDIANQPHWKEALAASFRPQAEQFANILAPGIDSKFAGSGRTGGGAHFDTTMRGVQDLERSQSDSAAKAAAGLYDSALGRQFSAASALPGVLNAKSGIAGNWLGVLNGVGASGNAEQQRLLDDQNAKYDYGNRGQMDWLTGMAQRYLGMYPGGQTQGTGTSSGYSTGSPGGGGFGSIAGPIMSGIGMALPFLSDRRDKKDIEELGVDPLTGLKTYAYRYKGDAKSTPKTVGPMAQEAEEKYPAFVREIGGHKVVSAALMPSGGLL